MRIAIAVLVILLSIPAHAVDYRWTQGFGQGTLEAIIRNANGSSVNIYCPAGQEDTTPGIFIEASKVRPKAGERVDVQIVVDRNSHAFSLEESQFRAEGRANKESLAVLVTALRTSKSRSFVVEFPASRISERFSLLDARKALGTKRNEILDGCE
jgi:hypothetical protein